MKYLLYLFIIAGWMVITSCGAGSRAYNRKHGGYDSQTWTRNAKRPYDINLRTYTGYPRNRKK